MLNLSVGCTRMACAASAPKLNAVPLKISICRASLRAVPWSYGRHILLAHTKLAERLAAAGARGRTLTLKLKRRKAGAPEPRKFLGALAVRACLS